MQLFWEIYRGGGVVTISKRILQTLTMVPDDSYFWNASGLRVTASVKDGLEMQLGSVQTEKLTGVDVRKLMGYALIT